MIRSEKTKNAQEKERFRIPKKVQDVIPIKRVWTDGIFLTGRKYSKCWRFTDINFLVASEEDKETMLNKYAALLNGLDSESTAKITVSCHKRKLSDFVDSVMMDMKNDDLDIYRKEANDLVLSAYTEASGGANDNYLTVSIFRRNIEEARAYFKEAEIILNSRFKALGSKLIALNAAEHLRILHDFYCPEEDSYVFDLNKSARLGHSFMDYIAPSSIERCSDYMIIGGKYARVFFLKDYASLVDDDILTKFTSISNNMMLSIDISPVPTDQAVKELESKLLGIETNISNWQQNQNKNNNFSATVPYDMALQRQATKELLDDIVRNNQHMMMAVITMVITADSKEELELETKSVLSISGERSCQMAILRYQQQDGLNTVLPIGPCKIDAKRTFNTESLAIFVPFRVQEIQDSGGIYLGQNAISHNIITLDRSQLTNQSGFYTGIPGSGKSFGIKQLIWFLALATDDDILVFDPEGEYVPIAEALKSFATVVRIAAGGKDHINAMRMVDGYGENDPIVVKSEFILSLIEQIDKTGVGPQQKSILDRCIKNVYKNSYETDVEPTLCLLREELLKQPETEAMDLALSLELYTTGSLDIFGHETNVDLSKRIVVYDAHGLSAQLKPTGLLVITDNMLNRVTQNWKIGKRTHIFIDEVHVVFQNPYSAQFFSDAWKQFRKRNACPTAITQNVEYILSSIEGRTMLSNSELVVMFNQAAGDREELARLFNISPEQLHYITDVEPGCGLIRYGGSLVPFVNRFPKDTKMYKLMTTRPGEGRFARGVDWAETVI